MLALLSPAKSLDESPVDLDLDPTRPALMDHTRELMDTARGLSVQDLKDLMSISDDLATLNHDRFQAWSDTHDPERDLPAALTFDGDVYKGLDARSLDADALAWSQDHVAILSGLYGVLRPLDLMQPYRLEMGTRLSTGRGRSLYEFWGTHIADTLEARVADHADPTYVNLASKEYFSAVAKKSLSHPVVDIRFEDVKNGKARVISFYAKRARGALARWIIENRAETVTALKDAVVDDYRFVAEDSTDRKLVYRRQQPPPKSKR